MPSRYTFTDYDPGWPAAFEEEAARLRELLGSALLDIHHIGSTSIPGLAAKPIIDLLPVAREIEAIDENSGVLESADYTRWGEYGLPGRRFFTRDHDGLRTHNIHIYEEGHPDIDRHLAFAAYLRAHPKIRADYELLKRVAYASHPDDIDAYNARKDAWIKRTEPLALAWFLAQR